MFSHRWCKKDEPDDNSNSKAHALVEWAKYRKACGLRSFFWIDYSCVDQKSIMPGVTMLPLYVASCNNIVSNAVTTDEAINWTFIRFRCVTILRDMKSEVGVESNE